MEIKHVVEVSGKEELGKSRDFWIFMKEKGLIDDRHSCMTITFDSRLVRRVLMSPTSWRRTDAESADTQVALGVSALAWRDSFLCHLSFTRTYPILEKVLVS
ncbi:hypothetical protein H5410_020241 [Solanum commersonii]|uniref:Uncharacterized protein n=1 Tax=Solanum commersonii TaxID=4109 RepID=A0A9J5ZAM8_SOLCO|nr:hypothetical protein H5410_020241 [Solanum commersonii]